MQFLLQPLRDARLEQQQFLASPDGQRIDWSVAAALLGAAVLLTIQHYALVAVNKSAVLASLGFSLSDAADWRLLGLTYWALGQTALYVIVPLLLIKLVCR